MTSTLPFPLYHGTSTLFADSIRNHGLGGSNPVADLHAIDCLRKLRNLARSHLHCDSTWEIDAPLVDDMLGQGTSGSGMNWSHGHAYLSPARSTAIRYARSNAFGSEIISTCLSLHDRIAAVAPQQTDALGEEFSALHQLKFGISRPMLIEVRDISSEILLSENGGSPTDFISEVENAISDIDRALIQQLNFRLTAPVPASCLVLSLIRTPDGNSEESGYILEPIPVAGT